MRKIPQCPQCGIRHRTWPYKCVAHARNMVGYELLGGIEIGPNRRNWRAMQRYLVKWTDVKIGRK